MTSKEVIEYRDVFCPVCGTFFDLRQTGTEYRCRKCDTQKNCLKTTYSNPDAISVGNENTLMFTRSVVEFPAAHAWLNKTLTSMNLAGNPKKKSPKKAGAVKGEEETSSEDEIGAQRALVGEECPKCKNPKMYFWTQQLRSADEGQTVFYECPKCEHRYSVNT